MAGCFLGLIVLPLNLMRSIGVACAIAITTTLIVNITEIPCLLLLFPSFFSRCVEPFYCGSFKISYGARQPGNCNFLRKILTIKDDTPSGDSENSSNSSDEDEEQIFSNNEKTRLLDDSLSENNDK